MAIPIKEVLEMASTGYPDHMIMDYYNEETGKVYNNPDRFDGLAYFLAMELSDVCQCMDEKYPDEQQEFEIMAALEVVLNEVRSVQQALKDQITARKGGTVYREPPE